MSWRKELLKNFNLYAVTHLTAWDDTLPEKVEQALRAGVDVIQLRSKQLSDLELLKIGRIMRDLTDRYHKLFIVNDRVDLMLALDADGVHLGQDDLPTREARILMKNPDKLIGRSTHSLDQAIAAQQEGADYVGFGPIFSTPTKPTYAPIGLKQIEDVRQAIRIPFVCIGGIDHQTIEQVIKAGAERVAVVRAVFDQADVERATSQLKEKLTLCLNTP